MGYRFVIDLPSDIETGRRKQLTRTYDTADEAQDELDRITHELNRGTYISPNVITVDQWLDRWLKRECLDLENATGSNYRNALKPVRHLYGESKLQDLDKDRIDQLVEWMLTSGRRRCGTPGTGLSVRSVDLTLGRLKTALDVPGHCVGVGVSV